MSDSQPLQDAASGVNGTRDRADWLIRVDRVEAGYTRPVVGPVSFAAGRGDVIGLAGPNGSGKSTLLKALIGAARIFAGDIERRPGLQVSQQHQGFDSLEGFPLNGIELLGLTGARAEGLPAWIAPKLGERLDRLSGGQMQLLRVWACLMAPADVVLLDEPTNNLDRDGTTFLEATLARHSADRVIVVVSHDARFLRTVSTCLVELDA
jgi:ATPase subunit of ABC transporter with duplicated ATPase domains